MVLLVLLLALLMCAPAAAHHNPDHAEKHPEVGWSKKTDGGYVVTTPGGYSTFTHGPDRERPCKKNCPVTAPTTGPACATDRFQRFLYGYPSGGVNDVARVRQSLPTWLGEMDSWLTEASLESGGPTAAYKVLCASDGTVRVDAFPVTGNTFSDVVHSARTAGYQEGNAHYSILFDGSGSCGIANVLGQNRAPAYAVTWKVCWGSRLLMHENAHNQGAVSSLAPNGTRGAHCTDELDVMCYSDPPDYPTTRDVCASPERFDCNHDDYFDTAPEPGEWLTTPEAWNLGSTANGFVRLGGADPEPEPTPEPTPQPTPEPTPEPCRVTLLGVCVIR